MEDKRMVYLIMLSTIACITILVVIFFIYIDRHE